MTTKEAIKKLMNIPCSVSGKPYLCDIDKVLELNKGKEDKIIQELVVSLRNRLPKYE